MEAINFDIENIFGRFLSYKDYTITHNFGIYHLMAIKFGNLANIIVTSKQK